MIKGKQLGQLLPADTNAASLFSPTEPTIIKSIVVCNVTSTAYTFRIFLDDDGTTYSTATALFYDTAINGNETVELDVYWPMSDTAGNLAVRSSNASSINFTAFGVVDS